MTSNLTSDVLPRVFLSPGILVAQALTRNLPQIRVTLHRFDNSFIICHFLKYTCGKCDLIGQLQRGTARVKLEL